MCIFHKIAVTLAKPHARRPAAKKHSVDDTYQRGSVKPIVADQGLSS